MDSQISGGARATLRHMYSYRMKINGDPAGDTPWFYRPTQKPKVPIPKAEPPAAKYRSELLAKGLIELEGGSQERKPGNYTISESGENLFKRGIIAPR
jgi:hypothetical protein